MQSSGEGGGLAQCMAGMELDRMCVVNVRRLHDTDRSGWNLLLNFIPLIGFIVFLVYCLQQGTQGENRLGRDSRYE